MTRNVLAPLCPRVSVQLRTSVGYKKRDQTEGLATALPLYLTLSDQGKPA